jgi:hypothetical protein
VGQALPPANSDVFHGASYTDCDSCFSPTFAVRRFLVRFSEKFSE